MSRRNRNWWDKNARASSRGPREKSNRQGQRPGIFKALSITGLFSNPKLMNTFSQHREVITVFQILSLAVVTASVGTLIAKFVPESYITSNGVYIAGLVLILLIETIYQWGLYAAMLAAEEGVSAYSERETPKDTKALKSEMEKRRSSNVDDLRRTLEPIERVSLLAIGIMTHLIALQSIDANNPPPWKAILASDWAITLMLGLAGLLWQLKNQTHIYTLTKDTWVERSLKSVGNKLPVIVILMLAIASVVILSVSYWPWGLLSVLILIIWGVYYYKLYRNLQASE